MKITRKQLRQIIKEQLTAGSGPRRHPLDWDGDGEVDWSELEAIYSHKDGKSQMWRDGHDDGFTGAHFGIAPAHPNNAEYMAGFEQGKLSGGQG